MKPVLDPKRDRAGATPETLARALMRAKPLPPRVRRKTVVRDEVLVEKPVADQPSDRVPHLREGS